MKEAQKMLLDWENGDETVRNLWAEMNSWVYKGFNETYKRLGLILIRFSMKAIPIS
jgi:arginyl-tRNA synthetase